MRKMRFLGVGVGVLLVLAVAAMSASAASKKTLTNYGGTQTAERSVAKCCWWRDTRSASAIGKNRNSR